MNTNQSNSATERRVYSHHPAKNRSTKQSSRPQSAQLNYERYLLQARDEARIGNHVEAENLYQHAEHYFRLFGSQAL